MPAPIYYSHRLVEQQAKVRKQRNSPLPWLRPDAKSQVTLRYDDGQIAGIDAVVLSTQHDPGIKHKADLVEACCEHILKPVLPASLAGLAAQVEDAHQSDRQVRDRRPGRRLRPDRAQDHRRHLRRHGPPRRRRVLRQGPVQGRPLGRLRRALRGQEHRRRRHRRQVRGAGQLRHRRGPPDLHLGHHLRHRPHPGREDRGADRARTSTCAPTASSRCST